MLIDQNQPLYYLPNGCPIENHHRQPYTVINSIGKVPPANLQQIQMQSRYRTPSSKQQKSKLRYRIETMQKLVYSPERDSEKLLERMTAKCVEYATHADLKELALPLRLHQQTSL